MGRTYKSEDRIQQECFIWFNNTYKELRGLLFHVPNGGSRSAREGQKLKEVGVVPGVADLLFMYNGRVFCIEMKNKFGKQSPAQRKWQSAVQSQGIRYYVCKDSDTFKLIIQHIIEEFS